MTKNIILNDDFWLLDITQNENSLGEDFGLFVSFLSKFGEGMQ